MHPKLMDWESERVPKINEIWMLACIKNSLKNNWFRRPKFKKITKKTIPQTMYFLHAFFIDFGKVWGGFWERFGTSLASLGALLSVFFQGFVAKRTQEGPRGGQEDQNGGQEAPSWAKKVPQRAHAAPKGGQVRPKYVQKGPQTQSKSNSRGEKHTLRKT